MYPYRRGFTLLIVVLAALHCGKEPDTADTESDRIQVRTVVVTPQPLSNVRMYPGTIEPLTSVKLSTKIMGWIDKIYVEEGDQVSKDQPLAELRNQDLEARRAQAEAAIAEATAHYQNVKTNRERIKALFDQKVATQKELDDIETAFASAQSQKRAAEEMKHEVDDLLAYTMLKSPFDGIITAKFQDAGNMANPGQPILQIENILKVKIVAKVPEADISELAAGAQVRVQVAASNIGTNGQAVQSKIERIVPSADPLSRQFDVHVIIDNPGGLVKPGMFARIQPVSTADLTLLVPSTALFRRGQLVGLFVVDTDGTARLRWIRTGTVQMGKTEILSGLEPNERIVVEGQADLHDGQKVEEVR